jgi:hypothetical protein
MSISRTDLERAIVAEGRQLPAMLPGEYAGRIWLRLADIDPGGAPAPTDEQTGAVALARADSVLNSLTAQGVALVQAKHLPRGLPPLRAISAVPVLRRALNGQ